MAGLTTDQIAAALPVESLAPIIDSLDVERPKPDAVSAAVNEAFGQPKEGAELANRLYGLFKFLTDKTKGRAKWERLRSENPTMERDRVVLNLWELLETSHSSAVEQLGASITYHRVWLFEWFLGRYDLRRSRKAVGGGGWAANAHILLAISMAVLFGLRHRGPLGAVSAWACVALVLVLYVVAVGNLAWGSHKKLSGPVESALLALQSFVPRIAGAAVVGVLLLASSEELLNLVAYQIAWPWLLVPLVAGCAYLLIEMARRVHPLPPLHRLLLHGIDISVTALCHGMAITLIAERGLRKILSPEEAGPFELRAAASVTVFVFVIGLVVNLIWAEKPVTEPL